MPSIQSTQIPQRISIPSISPLTEIQSSSLVPPYNPMYNYFNLY
jgi:hypothetical protein